jgi:hypothetical protein
MASRGLVDVDVVRRWWRRALSAPSTTEGFWIPVALELWAQQFIDGRGRHLGLEDDRRGDRLTDHINVVAAP